VSEQRNLHIYKEVLVSGTDYDFSREMHYSIPHRLYADWAALVVALAKAVDPTFDAPPFPDWLSFETESIPSDGPYSANADYYMLDLVSCELTAQNGHGLKIHYENGRMGGGEPVNMETIGLSGGVSSHIYKTATSPIADVYVWHDDDKAAEIADIIVRHQRACLAKGIWKTGRGTILIQHNLTKIPHINDGVGIDGDERHYDSAEYVETTPLGEVVKRYAAAHAFSLEDEMTVSNIHRVIGDCLYEFYYSHHFWGDPEVEANLILSGLEPFEDVLPFDEKSLFG
jgi:hypothetical protein